MPHHERTEKQPDEIEIRECHCGCHEGKECSCGHHCGCRKMWLKIIAAAIIFFAGYGLACCCHCHCGKHHGRGPMLPPAYDTAGENGGTMIIINTDGHPAFHQMKKGKHHGHHMYKNNADNSMNPPVAENTQNEASPAE